MKIEGNTITFKSNWNYYREEVSGDKPCTVRILNGDEWKQLHGLKTKFYAGAPARVRIVLSTEPDEYFERDMSCISDLCGFSGYFVVMICWENPE